MAAGKKAALGSARNDFAVSYKFSFCTESSLFLNYACISSVKQHHFCRGQNWGRVENFRYNCCFIYVDASLPALDQYVEERVDHMVDAGLLNEAYDIYNLNAD
ncbi:hypothetical protein F0562_007166 [Nyssa sinensis]|uniref:Uncharacterized protein n=1 Tax=Nyssa sinensis TaxID=561372 RepID=A0A5J5A7A7_9ASTE|nr:hypothetical protein F0562_007166 [Nyssa sinensis]